MTAGPYRGGPHPGPPRFPPPQPSPDRPALVTWFLQGGWWQFVHLFTFGGLTVIPLAHAAVRIRRPWAWLVLVVSLVVGVGCFALVGTAPTGARGEVVTNAQSTIGIVGVLLLFLGTFGVLAFLRTKAYPSGGAPASGAYGPYDPAVGAALAARKRRAQAKALAAKDPMLAHELRIGRPDLPRQYDDGGLVDLNTAPADVISRTLGVEPSHAGALVQARQAAGRFAAVDDVFAWTDLPVHLWDVVRDRGVIVG